MPCVPCQVILWDQRANGMLDGVSKIAEIQMAGGKSSWTDEWGKRWYNLIYSNCEAMQTLVNELTGVHDAPRPAS